MAFNSKDLKIKKSQLNPENLKKDNQKWKSEADLVGASIDSVCQWKFLLSQIIEQFGKTSLPKIQEDKLEPKCARGHPLAKDENFFCVLCNRKYYP